jgi:hypothetical protein
MLSDQITNNKSITSNESRIETHEKQKALIPNEALFLLKFQCVN